MTWRRSLRSTCKTSHGKVKPVQAMPKGGWWMRVCAQTTELDFHILRAIVGMHVETPVEPNLMRAAVMDGTMDPELYKDLAAVAASLFARMAVKERSDGGRARRTGVRAPSIASFGAKGLTAPRFVVAQLVLRATWVCHCRVVCASWNTDGWPCAAFYCMLSYEECYRTAPQLFLYASMLRFPCDGWKRRFCEAPRRA